MASNPRPTAGKTPVPTRTVLPPPKRVSLNPQQQANLNVNRILQPQYNQAAAEAARQNQAIQAYTTAAIRALSGMPSAIGQDYSNAINAQQGMVDAAANSLRAVNPSGDVAKLLDSIGAPQAQTQQIQGNLNNTFNGGAAVGQYVNGVSPLGALRAQGLSAQTLAQLQPGNIALAGRQSLATALGDQGDTRAKIAAQYPQLFQDQLNTFASNSAKRQQLALEAQAAGLKTQSQSFDQNYKTATLTEKQNEFLAKQAQTTAKGKQPNSSLSKSVGYVVDSSGNPILKNGKRQILPGFNTNAQGRVVKSKKPTAAQQKAAAAAFPNLTKTQVQHLRSGVAAVFYGVKPDASGKGGLPSGNYQQAITEAVKAGYSRAAAVKMANRFYKPGKRGRPAKGNDLSGLGLVVPPLTR